MKKIILLQEIFQCKLEELSPDEQEMILKARKATKGSYSPYSGFEVGCTIQLDDLTIIEDGSNYENAAYTVTTCAERVLLHYLHVTHQTEKIIKIAVTAKHKSEGVDYVGETPVAPCGVCRQSLKEVEDRIGKQLIFLLDGFNNDKIYRVIGIDSLLPLGFGPASLGMTVK